MNRMRTTAGYVYVGAAGPSSAVRLLCIAAAGAEYCGAALCAGATRELGSGRGRSPGESMHTHVGSTLNLFFGRKSLLS